MENISEEDQETIREFLVESHENLSRLDQDLVELEKRPGDTNLLSSIFRTIHTIKGACGFLAFSVLEAITHQAETLLSQLRDGRRPLTPGLVSLILETVDATRKVLASIETSGKEGPEQFEDLTQRLRTAAQLSDDPQVDSPPAPEAAVHPIEPEPPAPKASPTPLHAPVQQSVQPVQEKPQSLEPERKAEKGKKKEAAARDEDVARPSAAVDSNIRVGGRPAGRPRRRSQAAGSLPQNHGRH
jgi:two-component system chemotaxis sensor kinase CheA